MRWQACQNDTLASYGYECASFTRPLRRSEPDGPQVELAVFRLPATGSAQERIGTLFFNPGGPGQPSGGSPTKGMLLPAEVRRAFDFVTWDPRGLGQSRPALADCAVAMPQRPATGPVDWQRVLTLRQRELAKSNRDCIARHRDLIPQMGTVEAAHDLDALRQALGDDRLSFWGISYGTVIGSTYAALFPGRVRALVLDGNVDPWIDLGGLRHSATSPDDAIRFFLQLHPDLKRPLQRSLARLAQEPLTLPDGSPLHPLGSVGSLGQLHLHFQSVRDLWTHPDRNGAPGLVWSSGGANRGADDVGAPPVAQSKPGYQRCRWFCRRRLSGLSPAAVPAAAGGLARRSHPSGPALWRQPWREFSGHLQRL